MAKPKKPKPQPDFKRVERKLNKEKGVKTTSRDCKK
jgi:hypothetical protein